MGKMSRNVSRMSRKFNQINNFPGEVQAEKKQARCQSRRHQQHQATKKFLYFQLTLSNSKRSSKKIFGDKDMKP